MRPFWTPEMDDVLRELWPNPFLNAATIGTKFNPTRTKNAVVGRAHRIGLPPKRPSIYHSPTNAGQPRRRKRPAVPMLRIVNLPMLPLEAPIVPADHDPLRISLVDIKHGQCRAVIESYEATIPTYCGHNFPTERRYSFCDYHMSIFMRR